MNRKILLALAIGLLMPLLTGCFFHSSGSNPVGDTSFANSQQSAQALSTAKPQIMASSYTKPVDRKYTFAKCSHSIGHAFRDDVKKAAARLRVSLMSSDVTDNIFITFEKMMVKSEKGGKTNITLPTRKIDLLSASTLSDLLAEQQLPEGRYNYMEVSVKAAEINYEGKVYKVVVPSKKIRFVGKFELKDGYATNLKVKFLHRLTKWKVGKLNFFMLLPVVKIGSELVPIPVEEVTVGNIAGSIENFVSSAKLADIAVSLEGTGFSTVTDSNGQFSFADLPAGVYNLKTYHPDFLDYSFPVEVAAGQIASVTAQLNPAVIQSSIGSTGWFARYFPFAELNGEYAEVSLETPVNIDFVSLAFVKAELKFVAEYNSGGAARCHNYLAATQQVSADAMLGDWWAGNNANLGNYLGEFYALPAPGNPLTVDVTEMIRSNPSSLYFLASQNMDFVDIRMTGIQLSIFYR
jgi:hypothetical protein